MQCERDRSSVTYSAAVLTIVTIIQAHTPIHRALWPCAVTDVLTRCALQGVHMSLVVANRVSHVVARPCNATILGVELNLYLVRIVARDAKRDFIVSSSRLELVRQLLDATFINLFALISETLTIR